MEPIKASDKEKLLEWVAAKRKRPDEIKSRVLAIFSPPGYGKTVLSAEIGQRTFFVADEMNGMTSFANHKDLKDMVQAVPFVSHSVTGKLLQLVESGDIVHDDGELYDVAVLDTVSGMASKEIQKIVSGNITKAARVSAESAGQPDYLVSEKRMMDLMDTIANFERLTVVLLFHTRIGDKLTPGDLTRPDVHAAAFRVINKYASVIAYLDIKNGNRRLQVMPTGNGVSAKTRYHFPSEFVSPDEFVAHIRKWQSQ